MIWLIMGILVLGVLLFMARPLYTKHAPQTAPDNETADYLEKIAQIDAQIETADETVDRAVLEAAKIELQRQIIKHTDGQAQTDSPPPALLLSSLFVIFTFAAIGLYALVGRPELTRPGALQGPALSQTAAPKPETAMTLEQAVARLEQRLEQDPKNPQGWVLYARSLITLRRYDEAVSAYEKTLELTDNDPDIVKEFERAKHFIDRQTTPGPSPQQMQDAASMTPEDRQVMIEGMVARLAKKLKANPDDVDGWTRLLQARRVLGQEAEAKADIKLIRETFKDSPDTAQQILSSAGWDKRE